MKLLHSTKICWVVHSTLKVVLRRSGLDVLELLLFSGIWTGEEGIQESYRVVGVLEDVMQPWGSVDAISDGLSIWE
jgi:hypothetical protein